MCSHCNLLECRQSPLLHTKGRRIQTSKGGKNSTAGRMWMQVTQTVTHQTQITKVPKSEMT